MVKQTCIEYSLILFASVLIDAFRIKQSKVKVLGNYTFGGNSSNIPHASEPESLVKLIIHGNNKTTHLSLIKVKQHTTPPQINTSHENGKWCRQV